MKESAREKGFALRVTLLILRAIFSIILSASMVFALTLAAEHAKEWADMMWESFPIASSILILVACSLLEFLLYCLSKTKCKMASLHQMAAKIGVFRVCFEVLIVFLGTCISVFMGLPLGCEAPACFIGASIVFLCFYHEDKLNKEYDFLDAGASLGFCLCFFNPISGLCYYLEDVKEEGKKTWYEIAIIVGGLLIAYGVIVLITWLYGHDEMPFFFFNPSEINLQYITTWEPYLLLLIVILLVSPLAFLFRKGVALTKPLFNDGWVGYVYAAVFATIFIVAIRCNQGEDLSYLLGDGRGLWSAPRESEISLAARDLLFRVMFSMLAFSFFHIGGQTIPTLMLGIAFARFAGTTALAVFPFDENSLEIIEVIFMFAFFASYTRRYEVGVAFMFCFPNFWVIGPYLLVAVVAIYFIDRLFPKDKKKEVFLPAIRGEASLSNLARLGAI